MGLLDGLFSPGSGGGLLGDVQDPQQVGLLNMGLGLLSAAGPSTTPVSLSQAAGRAGLLGMQAYQSALDHQMKRDELQQISDYRKAQAAQMNQKMVNEKELNDFLKSRLTGAVGTMPAADMDASIQALGQGAKVGDIGPTVTNAARMDAIRPQQLQGQSSTFPFSLNDIAWLKTKGVDLADVYKLATDPIKLEGGSTYLSRVTGQERYMPKIGEGMTLGPNGIVSLAPGYIDSMSALKGAETRAVEEAKAELDLLPLGYVGRDGRPIGGTRGQYINSLNQPAVPRTQQGEPGGREGLDLRLLSPQQQAFLLQRDPEAFANGVNRFAGYAPGPSAGSAPVLQSEAEKQLQIGAITGRQNTQQDLNKNWITASYNPVLEAGRAASTMTASLDALKTFNLQTGWGAEAKAHAANVLTGLGIAPESAKLFATNAQKFQSVAMDRLLTVLQAQKGPQTEGDSTRAQQTFAQLRNTPAANQFIADFARAKANMDARRAQFYQEALPLAQQTGDLNEIDRRWAKIQGSIWNDPVLQQYLRGK